MTGWVTDWLTYEFLSPKEAGFLFFLFFSFLSLSLSDIFASPFSASRMNLLCVHSLCSCPLRVYPATFQFVFRFLFTSTFLWFHCRHFSVYLLHHYQILWCQLDSLEFFTKIKMFSCLNFFHLSFSLISFFSFHCIVSLSLAFLLLNFTLCIYFNAFNFYCSLRLKCVLASFLSLVFFISSFFFSVSSYSYSSSYSLFISQYSFHFLFYTRIKKLSCDVSFLFDLFCSHLYITS